MTFSISSSVTQSEMLSYSVAVAGYSWAAIACAFSFVPALSKYAVTT
jgi:hypothetical protein